MALNPLRLRVGLGEEGGSFAGNDRRSDRTAERDMASLDAVTRPLVDEESFAQVLNLIEGLTRDINEALGNGYAINLIATSLAGRFSKHLDALDKESMQDQTGVVVILHEVFLEVFRILHGSIVLTTSEAKKRLSPHEAAYVETETDLVVNKIRPLMLNPLMRSRSTSLITGFANRIESEGLLFGSTEVAAVIYEVWLRTRARFKV